MIGFTESNFYKALQDFFINNYDKDAFLEMLAEFYNRTESIIEKDDNQDDLIKELRELFLKFNEEGIDENIVREKVNYFVENNEKIQDIIVKIIKNKNNIENITSQLEQTRNYINNGKRKIKPLVCNNLWFINRNEEQMRNMINAQIKMGIEGFVLCFHLELSSTGDIINISENIESTLKITKEFIDKGVYFSALKFHCTEETLSSSVVVQRLYKEKVLEIANTFSNLGIDKCIILNERNDMYKNENISFINDMLNKLKALGYKVSINANSRLIMIDNYRDFNELTTSYDFISCNIYPQIGAKGRNTTLQDCIKAWETNTRFNDILSSNKKFYLTETGIRPYWIYFASPPAYQYDNPNEESIEVQLLYYKAIFESSVGVMAEEIWLWFFPEFYNKEIEILIKSYTGKGDL